MPESVTRGEAAGRDLIALGNRFDRELTPDDPANLLGMVQLGLCLRGRRLLRAAYRLLDAGDVPEAAALLRILSEYLIVARWIGADETRRRRWTLSDLRRRKETSEGVLRETTLDSDSRQSVIDGAGDTKRAIKKAEDEMRVLGESMDRITTEEMAHDLGLHFAYDFAYRVQSQADVHASALAIDHCYEVEGDQVTLRPVPNHGLQGYDAHMLGAHLLLDLYTGVSDLMPQLGWKEELERIEGSLHEIRREEDEKP